MLISILKSKLHQARVTDANLEYEGSMGVSRELLQAVGLLVHERVLVSNLASGQRFETYVIELDEPGQIVLNGAAAHCGKRGDRVIVMSFALLTPEEAAGHQARVAVLDEPNRVVKVHQ
jgi:aspartate 1-decarboxylase